MMRLFARRVKLKRWAGLIDRIAQKAESCSRQLRAWADKLQNSDIKGPRHLTDESRARFQKATEQKSMRGKGEAMQREILTRMPDGHPFKEEMRRRGKV